MNSPFTHVVEGSVLRETTCLGPESIETERDKEPSSFGTDFAWILEDLPDLLCIFDPAGRIMYANASFLRFFQKDIGEVVRGSVFCHIPRRDRKRFSHIIENIKPQNPVRRFEYRSVSPTGDGYWHVWTLKALFGKESDPTGYLLSGKDITNVKTIEEDLIYAIDQYAMLSEAARKVIMNHDKDAVQKVQDIERLLADEDRETLESSLEAGNDTSVQLCPRNTGDRTGSIFQTALDGRTG